MSTKKCMAILSLIGIIGSLVTFYGTNLLMSDLSNMYYATLNKDILASFPFFIFSLDFVLATLFVIRLYKHPDQRRALIKLYTLLLVIFSFIGIIFSILSGALVYQNFFAPYPFFAYSTVCLALHTILLIGGLVINITARRKLSPDASHRRIKPKYVGYTFVLCLLAFFAYNRFGALLTALVYVQTRTLYLTWPFYLSLLLPLSLLVYVIGNFMGLYGDRPRRAVAVPLIILVLDLILFAVIASLGSSNTLFIAAISPALGLERLATMPIDNILMFGGVALLAIYYTIFAALYNRKIRRRATAAQSA